ncbi:335_t:CDS:1, partial [Ambispora gerdemannii]
IPKEIVKNSKADNGSIGAEVDYVEKLLNVMNIKGFNVLYPTSMSPDIFTLRRITGLHCSLCN